MDAILKHTIPSLVGKGVFGAYEFISVGIDDEAGVDAQFSSELLSVNLRLRNASGSLEIIPLVIKLQAPKRSAGRNMKTLFYNEFTMYEEILPLLNPKNIRRYPIMYYGHVNLEEDLSKDILIMKNLKVDGYEISRQNVFLDYDHIAISMKAIGEFHSWSYNWKANDSKTFHEKAAKLEKELGEGFDPTVNGATMRKGIKLLLANGTEVDVLNKFLKTIENPRKFLDFVHAPTEPFAVILHGDYCKNNMQFKYNDNGLPTECVYFDFQTTKYASPVVDLAFFLYMHTTQETRQRWDDYLRIYWTSVEENVSDEVKLPSFEEFLGYFATKAVLGYFPSSFFLPMMIAPEEVVPAEEYVKLSLEERLNICENIGGEEAANSVRDIVAHLIEKRYIHSFLDYYEQIKPY